MSYDVYLVVDTGRTYTDHRDGTIKPNPVSVWETNYTSNCSRMWCTAGVDLHDLEGMSASEAAPRLEAAIEEMRTNPGKYKAMNPENGWGDYDSALQFLNDIRNACRLHPKTTVHIDS